MCKEDGCQKEVYANGFCHTHYDADRLVKSPECSVDGCDNNSHAKGLCNKHYRIELQKNKPECLASKLTNNSGSFGSLFMPVRAFCLTST